MNKVLGLAFVLMVAVSVVSAGYSRGYFRKGYGLHHGIVGGHGYYSRPVVHYGGIHHAPSHHGYSRSYYYAKHVPSYHYGPSHYGGYVASKGYYHY